MSARLAFLLEILNQFTKKKKPIASIMKFSMSFEYFIINFAVELFMESDFRRKRAPKFKFIKI